MDNLFGFTVEALVEKCTALNIPVYRGKQIAEWMYRKGANSFDMMTNLSKSLRTALARSFSIRRAKCVERWDSSDGKTSKFLLEFSDGVAVETVLMRQPTATAYAYRRRRAVRWAARFARPRFMV